MRIITGKYKGRHFDIPRTFKARPTTDFAKENIFNVMLQFVDFDGAAALDLFSGTGSITLELLSRGCRPVVSVELDRDHHRFIQECLRKLTATKEKPVMQDPYTASSAGKASTRGGATDGVLPIRGDVFRFIKSCRQQFDIIFADPPYALPELPTIPDLIFERNLLKDGGLLVFEHGKNHDFSQHPHFLQHREYGSVNFSLFKA